MISVLIPVYRYPVVQLVNDLNRILTALEIPFEIRLIDDNSPENEKQVNRQLKILNQVSYTELPSNIGRSAIRNLLAKEARYEWLWFLDCDSQVGKNQEIASTFWKSKSEDILLSGGRIYGSRPEDSAFHLHWEWASKRELIDPDIRMRDPVNNFLSNNFFLHRKLLEKVPFNEELRGYGYEDTLFASALVSNGFKIKHINNPVIHEGLEPRHVFLKKIEESLHNLLRLEQLSKQQDFVNPLKSKLYNTFCFIRKAKLLFVLRGGSKKMLPMVKRKISSNPKSLMWFDIYRLFYLISITDE